MPDWKALARERAGLSPASASDGFDGIADELAQHLEDRYEDLRRQGVPEDDAVKAALDELPKGSNVAAALRRESARAKEPHPVLGAPGKGGLFHGLASDVRYAARSLAKTPGFTAVALLTMALGIGANAVLFTVVNAVLLRPLPFPDPERLVTIRGSAPQMGLPVFNYPDAFYLYFRERSRTLERLTALSIFGATLSSSSGEPERILGARVTEDFFRLMGHEPALGRGFRADETRKGARAVVVLSHSLWQRRFGGDPSILGRPLVIDGRPAEVVGVMPQRFAYPYSPQPTQAWFPLPVQPESLDCWCWLLAGRLSPGLEPEAARAELARISDDFWLDREGKPRLDPDSGEEGKAIIIVQRLAHTLVSDVRAPLLVLLGAVGLVLLIACANVANLLLARAAGRTRDIAVRGALGASPWRLARHLLVESLLLAGLGAGLGLVLAQASLHAIRPFVSERVAPHVEDVGLDVRVLTALLVVTVVVGVLFGLAPALRGARVDLNQAVKDGGRATRGRGGRRLSQAFVVAQFALSLVLLVGAGLLLRSFRNLMQVDLGFRPENVLVGRIAFPSAVPVDPGRVRTLYAQLLERVSGLPGVQHLGLSSVAPFSQSDRGEIFTIRGLEPGPKDPQQVAATRSVTPGYFAAVGTPLLRGRGIEEADTAEAPRVAVVDESLARRIWPDGDAIGKEVRFGGDRRPDDPWYTIVGVAASIKHGNVRAEPVRYVYTAQAQRPQNDMDLVVRTVGDPGLLAAPIRAELQALDPTLPFYEVHTLQNAVADTLGTVRLTELLLRGFAVAAALLAALGIYGVMALSVSHRVNEFGVRLALGASPRDVRALVLGHGLRLAFMGAVVGLLAALPLGRLLSSLLFGVAPVDPPTFSAVAVGLLAVAALACYLPARRATATDPVRALRAE